MQQDQLVRVDRPLQRQLGGTTAAVLPTLAQVRDIIITQVVYDRSPFNSSSSGFRNHAEGWVGASLMHNAVHVWVGGDMLLSTSPNDPVFFLHHCNVDRVWAAWQRRYPSAPYVPDQGAPQTLALHRIDDPLHTFFDENPPITARVMLDYEQFYQYDTFSDLLGS